MEEKRWVKYFDFLSWIALVSNQIFLLSKIGLIFAGIVCWKLSIYVNFLFLVVAKFWHCIEDRSNVAELFFIKLFKNFCLIYFEIGPYYRLDLFDFLMVYLEANLGKDVKIFPCKYAWYIAEFSIAI